MQPGSQWAGGLRHVARKCGLNVHLPRKRCTTRAGLSICQLAGPWETGVFRWEGMSTIEYHSSTCLLLARHCAQL